MSYRLTKAEKEVIYRLAGAVLAFRNLPDIHSSDNTEFRNLVMQAERMVLARPAQRQLSASKKD